MDPLLRGVCEQYIDSMLREGEIEKIRRLVDLLDLPIASKMDASLGVFIGAIYSQLDAHYLKMYNRLPKKEEVEDYHGILRRRASEIKSKFRSRMNQLGERSTRERVEKQVKSGTVLDEYHLVLQKRTEELRAEKELQTESKETTKIGKPESPGIGEEKKVKFSYNSSTKKEPVRKILGIPIMKKEKVSPTVR